MYDALNEAKLYLWVARKVLSTGRPRMEAVCVALCAHALIRANDSLCLKFFGEAPKRHDDASRYFQNLYSREHKIPEEEARYKKIIDKWIKKEKAKAEYGGAYFSGTDAKGAIKDTEEFIKMVERYVI